MVLLGSTHDGGLWEAALSECIYVQSEGHSWIMDGWAEGRPGRRDRCCLRGEGDVKSEIYRGRCLVTQQDGKLSPCSAMQIITHYTFVRTRLAGHQSIALKYIHLYGLKLLMTFGTLSKCH